LSILGFPERLSIETTKQQSRAKTVERPDSQPTQGETTMQFFAYDPNYNPEGAPPPTPELMAEMGNFIGEAMQAGVLIATGTLQPRGTRIKLSGGKFAVTDGPFIELKELLGGWALLRTKSVDEAVEWSKRFLTIVGEGETELVQVLGADDPA
jgi:hypothetical protein